MVYFEYEYLLEEINVIQKQQEEQNANHQKEYSSMQNSMMPKMPQMTMPKIQMPTIQMPKL